MWPYKALMVFSFVALLCVTASDMDMMRLYGHHPWVTCPWMQSRKVHLNLCVMTAFPFVMFFLAINLPSRRQPLHSACVFFTHLPLIHPCSTLIPHIFTPCPHSGKPLDLLLFFLSYLSISDYFWLCHNLLAKRCEGGTKSYSSQ